MVKRRITGGVASALVALGAIACNAIGGISEHEAASGGTAGAAPSGAGGSIVRGSGGSAVTGAGGNVAQGRGGRDDAGGTGGAPPPIPEGGMGPIDGSGGLTGLGGSPPMPVGGEGGVGPVPCVSGTRACQGNIVVECDGSGEWIALPIADQCGGATPACSGAGTCAALRLRSGSIETFGVTDPPPATSKYVLREQTLLTMPRVCSATYCVTGGIRP